MKNIFLSHIMIEKVRHLENISISLHKDKMMHLIFTGRNGSGKTSVLDALSHYLNSVATSNKIIDTPNSLQRHQAILTQLKQQGIENEKVIDEETYVKRYTNELNQIKCGLSVGFNDLWVPCAILLKKESSCWPIIGRTESLRLISRNMLKKWI